MSARPEREREDAVAVTDGGDAGKGGRGIERGEERRERESVGVGLERVLETVAAVLPDQFRWTADTNCFSGLNRAVLSPTPFSSASLFVFLSSLSPVHSFSRTNLHVSIGRKCPQNRLFSAVSVPLFLNEPSLRFHPSRSRLAITLGAFIFSKSTASHVSLH